MDPFCYLHRLSSAAAATRMVASGQSNDKDRSFLRGTVTNFPRRRAVHPRLFFLEVQEVSENADISRHHHQVLFKHGQGGHFQDGAALEDLRRSVRKGDTVEIEVGHEEANKDGSVLLHAASAYFVALHVHGNTGSSYQLETIAQDDTAHVSCGYGEGNDN
ncbi:expressed unknown protein [Seminavis robusta]|uniref:Uncharacterized protein n=1 Tax=Seminavis robusta TaxID=568900 RepID=A0A9N8H5A1_9STRA|nr:expressed unknown protein [Seminavis robusta]|eukprot:Sro69_g038580.1 n/a (161) ;mRNA; f:66267-66749